MVKTLMLAAFVAVSVCGCTAGSGKKCIVEGNLQGVEGEEWIYMVDAWNGKEVLDSTKCKDGMFRFETVAEKPTKVELLYSVYGTELPYTFFNDPGTISLSGPVEGNRNVRVTGTPMNDAYYELEKKMVGFMRESSIVKRAELCTIAFKEELGRNLGNALSLQLVMMSEAGMHPSELIGYMDALEPYLKEKTFARNLRNKLERLLLVSPGIEGSGIEPHYIDMEYPAPDGNMTRLSDVVEKPENKYVLIDFWATWCGACIEVMEMLEVTYNKYKDKGFEVYSVSIDQDIEAWKKFISAKNTGWIDVIGGINNPNLPEWNKYVISGIPASILIDCSTGCIIGRDLHGDMLDAKLEELL